ncbi:hypothetical protein DM02DRAFT_500703, partial [Periconia macrospinosa]
PEHDTNAYFLGEIGEHKIVMACLPAGRMGVGAAAVVADNMRRTFKSIRFGFLVGIGGGVPYQGRDIRLGDVVVSVPNGSYGGVVQYDFGKMEAGGTVKHRGQLNSPPEKLLSYVALLQNLLGRLKNPKNYVHDFLEELEGYSAEYGYPAIDDKLYQWTCLHQSDVGPCDDCDVNQLVPRQPRKNVDPVVHLGIIASGNMVIGSGMERDRINKEYRNSIFCFEMEAAGLMNNFPCLVIRGISDYADSHKNDHWRNRAIAAASAYTKALIRLIPPAEVCALPEVAQVMAAVCSDFSLEQEHKARSDILDWLTPVDYGPQQSDYIRKRQTGTGQWLLDSEKFQTWLKTNKQTLFCPGIPGAGKTILTSIVIDYLGTKFQKGSNTGIAYLYCNFRRQHEQKPEDLLGSLLKQFIQEQSSIPESVKVLYDRHKDKRTRPSLDEISRALHSITAVFSRVFIIVDALDECQATDGYRIRFLSDLFSLQAKSGANIFTTSRFIPEITEKFKGSIALEIVASDEDVRRYLGGHMSRLPGFVGRNEELKEEIKTEIVKAVDGMFLLAQLHLDSLVGKRSPKAVRAALKGLPTGFKAYDHAYEEAMKRIEGQVANAEELAKQVLSWITCAKRLLNIAELRHALAVEIGEPDLDEENLPEVEDMVSVCAGLVTVDEESHIIRLVHYTTQEYFERTQKKWFPNAETYITTTCVNYLSFSTFESGFCRTDKDFEERLQSNQLYNYAARNWGYHGRQTLTLSSRVINFLESEAKVEASSQAMMVDKRYSSHSNYSQEVPRHMTGLHLAAYFGLEEEANTLLAGGHRPDLTDSYGRTPLSYAAGNGHEAVVKLLLATDKVDPDSKGTRGIRSYDGLTLLSLAAQNGHEAIVKLLLATDKVDPDSKAVGKYNKGQTPLSLAAQRGHEAIVK